MKNLKGETISVGQLLSQEFFFRIPEYQRPFSWEGDNFENLIDDVITASKEQEYFLGTIVLHKTDEKGNYDVVDGQQRLTSLMILLACLRDAVDDDRFKDDINLKIVQKENVVDEIPQKVRVEVKDREIFSELVVANGGTTICKNENGMPEPEWRYIQATNIFKKRISPLSQDDLQKLINFLSQKCVVIYLATSTFDDAFRLFTIVNDRGKQLRRIDVLKSINIAPDIVTKPTVRNRIAQRWEELEKDLGEGTFESVFHLMRFILLKDKPQEDVLREFQNRIFATARINKGEPFVNLVFEYADLYKRIFEERNFVKEDAPEYIKYLALISIMDTEFKAYEWRACLLAFAKKFKGEKFYEFCLQIEKVFLSQWTGGVRRDERYSAYSEILGNIEASKKADDVLSKIAYDPDPIIKIVEGKNLYGSAFCKYVLLRLELLASEHDVPKEFSAKSIEHVLPQHPDDTGYWAEHHDLKEIGDYMNSVGNLVLLSKSKNSSAQNYPFPTKKDKYLKNRVTDYPRSVQVLAYRDWDKATVLKRTKDAKETFLNDL